MNQSPLACNDYFNHYLMHLESFSAYLAAFCKQTYKLNPYFCWMSPLPQNTPDSDAKKIDFNKYIHDTDHLIKIEGFTNFDRLDIWSRRQDLMIAKSRNFL